MTPSHSIGKDSESPKVEQNGPAQLYTFFYKSVAGDPGEVEMDWRLLGVGSIAAFPRTVEIEPAKTHMMMLPYKHALQ